MNRTSWRCLLVGCVCGVGGGGTLGAVRLLQAATPAPEAAAMPADSVHDKHAKEENAGVGQGFIGAQRCGQCHAFAYQVWQQSAHARAHLSLTAAQLGDSRCRSCHTVSSALAGVQCESCHGPGKYYQADYVMRDRELARAVGLVETQASHCQQCHTPGSPSLVAFDFKTMWAAIDHSRQLAEQNSPKP